MDWNAVFTIAAQEVKVNVRNKWMLTFAVVFGGLALAVSYFGMITFGTVGVQNFTRTTASLLNLVLYLIPLVALIMATLSFSGEKGTAELLFSQPISRGEILVGKLAGLFACIAGATCTGFGVAGIVIATRAGGEGSTRYALFVGLALLLALVFLALGSIVAVFSNNRAKALGTSIFLWFFFVIFYDLLAMGVTFLLKERTANMFIFLSLFGNPVDLVRVSSLITLGGTTVFGAAGAALMRFLGGAVLGNSILVASLLVWTVVPFLIVRRFLSRQDV
jgi:Cu-processing system permease protein